MDMDCKSSTDLITKVLSGNAAGTDEVQLRAHLDACPACAAVERGLARTWALMGQLQPLTSEAKPPLPVARPIFRRKPLWIAAAAAIVVVSTFALLRPTPQAPKAPEVAPVAVQVPAEEPRTEQRKEEVRVQEVLTRIENEKPAPVDPVVEKPAPVVATPERPAPQPEKQAPERKEAVAKTPTTETRPVPAPSTQPAVVEVLPIIATLDRVEGDVTIITAGTRSAAKSGSRIAAGDALETAGKASNAVLEFPDGTRLVLGADTVVDSVRLAEGKRVSLKQGVLAAQVSRQPAAEPMIFMTASAEARVLGTRLTLSVTPSTTRLEVREGKVRMTRKDDGASVDVPADHFIVVGKGLPMTPKPAVWAKVALRETFDRSRWSGAWSQGGDVSLGIKMSSENGSLAIKAQQKPPQDVSAGKMPNDAAEAARKAVQNASGIAGASRKEWPRAGWLETRQAYPFSNEAPLRIRTRTWSSHQDADRLSWIAINRGTNGQGLSLERRGESLQLWVDGATQPVWKKDAAAAQEWETVELWISKDQMVVRRNDQTLYTGPNPLKIKAGTVSLGLQAKLELAQDEEVRFDDVDVILTTRVELDEVAR